MHCANAGDVTLFGRVLTTDQQTHIMNCLKDIKIGQQSDHTLDINASANCASIITPHFNPSSFSFSSQLTSNFWIFDSGASGHMILIFHS